MSPRTGARPRVLAHDVTAPVDAPPFDRSNVDGFAVRAADTSGASDTTPRQFALNAEVITCGHAPALDVTPGTATTIATGGVIPRGADAVVMIEHTDLAEGSDSLLPLHPNSAVAEFGTYSDRSRIYPPSTGERAGVRGSQRFTLAPAPPHPNPLPDGEREQASAWAETLPAIEVRRAVAPGQFISYAGSDIARGEVVLRRGARIGSREIGMLAACGIAAIDVVRKPKVAVLSTGDELVPPGEPLRPASVYDSNGAIIAAAVTEAGGEPSRLRRIPR